MRRMDLPSPTAASRRHGARACLALLLPLLGAACIAPPRQDAPEKVRHDDVFLPPFYSSDVSADGTSWSWDAALWLLGQDVEGERRHARALPLYWHDSDPLFGERELWFPFYYRKDSPAERTRWYSLFYGRHQEGEVVTDYVLFPLYYDQRSETVDYRRTGFFLLWDWRAEGPRRDVTLVSLLGLATLVQWQSGLPPDGETVGALGREHSRRVKGGDVLGIVTLFGYDDVGDRRELRFGTLFSNEPWSLFRSWRSRDPDNPFVSEWLFPLYMNRYDEGGDGFHYVGPLWGGYASPDEESETDWWALGLVSRNRSPVETTWRIAGIPVSRSPSDRP